MSTAQHKDGAVDCCVWKDTGNKVKVVLVPVSEINRKASHTLPTSPNPNSPSQPLLKHSRLSVSFPSCCVHDSPGVRPLLS